MKRACLCGILMFCLAISSLPVLAAEPAPVETRVKRVALFKNGLGFFVREGSLPASADVVLVGPFTVPSHGTFWVSCPARDRLESVVAREVTVPEKIEARAISELLRANIGKEVILGGPWEPAAQTGTILGFAPDRPEVRSPADTYAMGRPRDESAAFPPGPGQFMLLQTNVGIVALDPNSYGRVTFPTGDLATTLVRDTVKAELEARFASPPKAGDWLSVSYLAKGITWAPSYLIDVSDPKQASLSAKALVINEAEPLTAAHVDLITGFPNLQFADVLSPIAMKEDLAAFLRSLARGGTGVGDAAVMRQEVAYDRFAGRGGAGAGRPAPVTPAYGAAAAGQVAEDLFLYPVEDVTLGKGETGYYPLFTESVPYTEFYQWQIPDYITPDERYQTPRTDEGVREVVWHCLRLTNSTKLPWTTAPAELVKEGSIIGQDTLGYTPPKAQATVRITQAVSVRAEQSEVETARERDVLQLYGDHFDRITIEGKLRVTNYQDKPVSLEITKVLSGEVKSATPQPKDVALARGLARMNPVHELTWTVQLEPGGAQDITYTYEALIRR